MVFLGIENLLMQLYIKKCIKNVFYNFILLETIVCDDKDLS